jgi:glycosyltransferase involved in cell wall biosynthesis
VSAWSAPARVLVVQNSQMAHHPRHHYRLAAALAEAGADVRILSQPDPEPGHPDVVPVDPLPVRASRIARIASGPMTILRALARRPDVIYVVSLELLPWAVAARALGRCAVMYDSNEEYHDDMLRKEWLPPWSRRLVSALVARAEPFLASRLDAVTTAVPATQDRFRARGADSVLVRNFPPLSTNAQVDAADPMLVRRPDVLVGGTVQVDLVPVLADTIARLDDLRPGTRWRVVLRDSRPAERELLMSLLRAAGVEDRVELLIDRPFPEMAVHMAAARVALVFFKGVGMPQRTFEYMAAGVPFVAADLPWMSDIVRESGAGVLAAPHPEAYAEGLAALLDDTDLQETMAHAGIRAARELYCFEVEAKGLVGLYEDVLGRPLRALA